MIPFAGLLVVSLAQPPAGTAAKTPAASRPQTRTAKPVATPATKPAPTPAATPAPLPTQRPPAPPGLSWDDADAVATTVIRLERRLRSGRSASDETVVVSERQLNSFVNLSLAGTLPPEVSGLMLQLERDRLGAHAMLDLDRVKEKLPKGATSGMLMFLTGTVPVEVVGRVSSANGTGRVEIEQASVAGVSLPASMLSQIVSLSTRTRTRPGGLDILAPFPLPWTARQVRLEPGRALVDFFPKR